MSQQNKYTKELLEEAAANSQSVAGVLRYLNLKQAGGNQCHIARRLRDHQVNIDHFTGCGHNKGKTPSNKKTAKDIMVVSPPGAYRPKRFLLHRALLECGVEETCKICGTGPEWNGSELVLHVDHIDGNWLDSTRDNLRFLCPHCHTQTKTFGTKNKPSYSNW